MKKNRLQTPASFKAKGKIAVSGATAPSGAPYVLIGACGTSTWLPLAMFRGGGSLARERLTLSNIILLGEQEQKLRALVTALREFPPMPLIEHQGWAGGYFALPCGKVFQGAKAKKKAVVLFERKNKVRKNGELADWLEEVAKPLAGQHLATFVLMVVYVAPLLRLIGRQTNFGFELAGSKGVGKSTLLLIASSAVGPAICTTGSPYWLTANVTMAGLEGLMAEHDDMPLILEETNLFAAGEADKARSSKFNELVFRLADGTVKARYQAHAQKRYWFVYLTSTNEPLEQVLAGERLSVSEAAADRLLTLPIGPERAFGVFDFVPEGYGSASAFAASLNRAITANYGTSFRRFVGGLVRRHRSDPLALNAKVEQLVTAFRKRANVDENNGSEARVANAFGLVYAAGCLARDFGALPRELKLQSAAISAYELNRSTVWGKSLKERLLRHSQRPDIIHFEDGAAPDLSASQVQASPGFILTKGNGRRDLLLTKVALSKLFSLPHKALKDPEIAAMLHHDEGRLCVKKKLSAKGKKVWVYRFSLPTKEA